jgi:hypothetical protein
MHMGVGKQHSAVTSLALLYRFIDIHTLNVPFKNNNNNDIIIILFTTQIAEKLLLKYLLK